MKTISRARCASALGAPLAALAALLFAGLSAPIALADTPAATASPSPQGTVLVPRITKGSYGTSMRVRRDSPEARIFFATQTPRLKLSATKNEAGNVGQKIACRPVALRNMKGAYSVAGGQRLVCCGPTKVAPTTFCAAAMPCAQGAQCPMAMPCAI